MPPRATSDVQNWPLDMGQSRAFEIKRLWREIETGAVRVLPTVIARYDHLGIGLAVMKCAQCFAKKIHDALVAKAMRSFNARAIGRLNLTSADKISTYLTTDERDDHDTFHARQTRARDGGGE